MNLYLYASAIALSCGGGLVDLSPAFILNFMQPNVRPSVEMMPCRIALRLSDLVFHRSR